MNLVFSSVFESDVAELSGYFFERGGPGVGDRFERALVDLVELLDRNPELGRLRRDLQPAGIRSSVLPGFRNYVLFYRIEGADLILLRLRFGGMDLPALFPASSAPPKH